MAFSLDKFVPENVVTAFLIASIRKAQVFAGLVRVHDGVAVKPGESFRVPGVGSITVGTYAGTTDISVQALSDTGVDISIDQLKYYAFYLDKVDDEQAAQSVLGAYVNQATYALSDTADTYLASTMQAGAGVAVTGGAVTKSNVIDWIGSMKQGLDESNCPSVDRWLVVTPAIASALAIANVVTSTTTSEEARSTGFVQRAMDFDVYMSNNLPVAASGTHACIAGVPSSTDYLNQIQSVEFTDAEKRFASISKGLHVYGAAVTQSGYLAYSNIND